MWRVQNFFWSVVVETRNTNVERLTSLVTGVRRGLSVWRRGIISPLRIDAGAECLLHTLYQGWFQSAVFFHELINFSSISDITVNFPDSCCNEMNLIIFVARVFVINRSIRRNLSFIICRFTSPFEVN